MLKNTITKHITPCCALPFSKSYWWISNLKLNSEADREYILTQLAQSGILSIAGWKVLANSAQLETDASFTKSELLSWFDCGRQPSCEQLKVIIEGLKLGNWTPETELPQNIALIDMIIAGQQFQGNVYTKEQVDALLIGSFGGKLMIADTPTPTAPIWYFAGESGTYANAGGLVVDTAGKLVVLNYDGTDWDMIEVAALEGKSAYQLAVENGFVGTEADWLDSLSIDIQHEEGKNKYNLLPQSEGGHTESGKGIDNEGNVINFGWTLARIPVQENTTYSFKHDNGEYHWFSVGAMGFFDENHVRLSFINMYDLPDAGGLGGKTVTTPAGTAFIYKNVVVGANNYLADFQLEEGTSTTAWTPYGDGDIVSIENKSIADSKARADIEILRDDIENLPTGNTIPKHLVLLGDSITWNPSGWVSKLMEKVSFLSVTNLAQSGATWSHRSGTVYDISPKDGNITDVNVIWNQVNDLIHRVNVAETTNVPDVIVITAGTNDHGGAPLGDAVTAFTPTYPTTSAAPNTMLTIAQAIRYSCELILQNFPKCQIILVTPVQMGIADNAHNFEIGQVIKDCGKYLGATVIDAGAESGIYGEKEFATPYDLSPDGIHPVINGINKLGAYMARQLKNTITI